MFNRKVLVGVVLLLAFGLLVTAGGCSLFKLSKDDQKEIIKEATEAFKDIDSYGLEGAMKQKDKEFDLELSKAGSDVSFIIKAGGASLKVVQKGDYVYMGNETKWLRYQDTGGSNTGNLSEQFEGERIVEDFKAEDIDNEKMVYEGKETVDGKNCYKFTYSELGNDKESGIIWIAVGDKKIKKIEITGSEENTTGSLTFSYNDIKVEEPKDYEEVDISKDYTKILEVMGDFMKANPDFGSSGSVKGRQDMDSGEWKYPDYYDDLILLLIRAVGR